MAKLQRKSAKLFAENADAGVGGVAQFGSLAAGNPNYSKDPDIIQALNAFKTGWSNAVIGNKSPAIEDRNALDYLLSYQQAYIMQRGIPEWIATETYYKGSFVSLSDGRLFVSRIDNNTNIDPSSDNDVNWISFPTPAQLAEKVAKAGDTMTGNLIMNGGTVYKVSGGTNYRVLDLTDKASIINWTMPDYSSGVSKTRGVEYTAECDGIIVFCIDDEHGATMELLINGTQVFYSGPRDNDGRSVDGSFRVKAGDTYKIEGGSNTWFYSFYPLLGV